MIIDSHAHVNMPDESYRYATELVASRTNPTGPAKVPDKSVRAAAEELIRIMDSVGTDVQLISPRPYMQMHSLKPAKLSLLWNRHVNDIIHRQVQMFPDRLRGVAGLPQHRRDSPENVLPELERCVKELGFVGCILNPDPSEGGKAPPALGDRFWYPLYEKLCELDVPALIHSCSSCNPRESYTLKFINEESIAIVSLLESSVFEDFPKLKLIVPHGGGAIPYQMGRFRAWAVRKGDPDGFDRKIKQLHYDTCNYDQNALELLFKSVGADNVLFGSEKPGTGSAVDPRTGRDFDDLKPVIENISFLSAEDKRNVFECNCKKLYTKAF